MANKQRVWELFLSAAPPLGYDFGSIFKGAGDPEFGVMKLRPWRIEMDDMGDRERRRVWQRGRGLCCTNQE